MTKTSDIDRQAILIRELLRENGRITRERLIKRCWTSGNTEQWDATAIYLKSRGIIRFEVTGNQVFIVMPEQMLKFFFKYVWKITEGL